MAKGRQLSSFSRSRIPFRLVVFADSTGIGGAELALGTLVGGLGEHVDVTVMGVDADIVHRIASARPGTATVLVPRVQNRHDIISMWRQRNAIGVLNPDIFYASLPSPGACQYALLGAWTLRRPKLVASERMVVPPRWRGTAVLKRITAARLSAHLAVSESAARAVERDYQLPSGSVRAIHNGVYDVPLSPQSRPSSGPIVGTLARADPMKGLDVLLHAAVLLPGVTVVIVGPRAEERGDLEQLAEDLGVSSRVHFVDWTDRARDYLTTFDVFVLASRYEALSNAVLEAMVAGLPVVATSVGGVPEVVVPAETGLLVSPDDIEGLARAIRSLLEDPDRRGRMGHAGRQRAIDRFSVERMIEAYEDVFDEVLGRRS